MTIDINKLRRLAQAATPGPWYVTGQLTRYVEARIDGWLIQEVAACGPTKADGGYGPQQEANARLIAAAPDLLAALQDVDALWMHHSIAHGDGKISPLHEKVIAAIAKATGEQL